MRLNFLCFSLVFTVFFMIHIEVFGLTYGVHLGGRNYVRGFSAEASATYEKLLWGQPKSSSDVNFGLLQLKAAAATHGLIKASASIFPISFVEIRAEQSRTYRYSSPAVMSCNRLQCYGALDRRAISARLALGWKDFVGFLSQTRSISEAENTGENNFDEVENLIINLNRDESESRAAFAGMKLNDLNRSVVGIALREFEYEKSKTSNRLIGAAFQTHLVWLGRNFNFSTLIGSYKSDFNPESISAAFAIDYSWGDEKLSIF